MQTIDFPQSLCASSGYQDKVQGPVELGFPSPASENLSDGRIFTPGAASTTDPTSFAAPAIFDAIPRPLAKGSLISETPSPLHETLPDFGLSSVVASVVPSNPAGLPPPPIAKAGRNLRLPSFDLLGIAAPHPDRIAANVHQPTPFVGAGPLSRPDDPLHLLKSPFSEESSAELPVTESPSQQLIHPHSESYPSTSPHNVPPSHKSIRQYNLTTPPDNNGKLDWSTSARIKAATVGTLEQGSTPMSNPTSSHGEPSTAATSVGTLGLQGSIPTANPPNAPWLRDVVALIVHSLDATGFSSDRVTVMSHALPLPSANGHAYPAIINAIHQRTLSKSTVWINVFHAVPGSINLADLPTSPPTTPAPPTEGEDYFATKVFDSAVVVPDYQGEQGRLLIPSPRPVVPPSSVDVTIVERYIPPTSEKEFSELFFPSGRSILSDRIVELDPKNGTLIFIYPTKRGGETFVRDYLSPILEPVLRAMMVGDNLPYDLINELGAMPAVDQMSTFEEMRARLEDFCQQLSNRDSTPLSRFKAAPETYTVVHASKQDVTLSREVWAREWWNKQEKPRIRRLVRDYHARTRRSGDDVSPPFMGTELVERLLERVSTGKRAIRSDSSLGGTGSAVCMPAAELLHPGSRDTDSLVLPTLASPIEVAVFVVKTFPKQVSQEEGAAHDDS